MEWNLKTFILLKKDFYWCQEEKWPSSSRMKKKFHERVLVIQFIFLCFIFRLLRFEYLNYISKGFIFTVFTRQWSTNLRGLDGRKRVTVSMTRNFIGTNNSHTNQHHMTSVEKVKTRVKLTYSSLVIEGSEVGLLGETSVFQSLQTKWTLRRTKWKKVILFFLWAAVVSRRTGHIRRDPSRRQTGYKEELELRHVNG